jgi:hypothetical protein
MDEKGRQNANRRFLMAFTRNRPTATEFLSVSQPVLLNNFNSSDDTMGIDHYPFSDITANNGFHKQATTPIIPGSVHPVSAVNPIFYAMQDSTNLGLLQYSIGPQTVPTPVTNFSSGHSPLTLVGPTTSNVLDCTGLTSFMGRLYVANYGSTNQSLMTVDVYYFLNGATPVFKFIQNNVGTSTSSLFPTSSGAILQIEVGPNPARFNNIFWSLNLVRINT